MQSQFSLFQDWILSGASREPLRIALEQTQFDRLQPLLTAILSGVLSVAVGLGAAVIAIRSNEKAQREQRQFEWEKMLLDRRAEHAERAAASIEAILLSNARMVKQSYEARREPEENDVDEAFQHFRTLLWFTERRMPSLTNRVRLAYVANTQIKFLSGVAARSGRDFKRAEIADKKLSDAQNRQVADLNNLRGDIAKMLDDWERHPSLEQSVRHVLADRAEGIPGET